jgi:hypothetical protein
MKPNDFRRVALSLPEASERAHVGHPDFRVGGRIFASLGYPDDEFGVVMLSPEQQGKFVKKDPESFAPVNGTWGKRGNTKIRLEAVDADIMRGAVTTAWLRIAPKRLAKAFTSDE